MSNISKTNDQILDFDYQLKAQDDAFPTLF